MDRPREEEQMKKIIRILIPILAVCLILAGVAGYFIWQWMTGPLYQPGMVRAGTNLRASLDPPPQPTEPDVWQVEPDIRLHYFASGEGTPVLIVHGGPGTPAVNPWSGLEPLKGDFRFYYYDQRGCGQSTRPFDRFTSTNYYENMQSLDRTLGLGAQIADIERIRRILGVEKITLIGHSFGAFIAALYATEFPEQVESLVLVSPAEMLVMPAENGGLFPLVRERLPESERSGFDTFLKEYLNFQNIFSKSEADLIALNNRLGDYYRQVYPNSTKIEQGEPGGWMVWGIYLSLGQRHDYRAAMKSTTFPVLVLHGADDLQTEKASRIYLGIYPQARFEVIPGASHFAFEENPEEFARLVSGFLGPK
jgi:proline iminopeptidase